MKTKSITAALLLFVSLLIFNSCNNTVDNSKSESTFEKIKREKVMNVGYVVYAPIVKKDPNSGQVSGHFVDAMKYIADEMGVKVIFHEADWSTFSAGLQSKRYDVCIAPTYSTIKRSLAVSFTEPIIYIGSSAIIKKSDVAKFKSLSDLNKKEVTIAVVQGEGNHEFAKRELPNATLKVLSTSNMVLPMVEVASKNADVALTDYYTAKKFIETNSNLTIISQEPFEVLPIGWSVRNDDIELINFLNNAIQYLESTGKMEKWEAQYDAHWIKQKIEYTTK